MSAGSSRLVALLLLPLFPPPPARCPRRHLRLVLLLLLLLLLVSHSSPARIIDKCCRSGDVLALAEDADDLECRAQVDGDRMSYYTGEPRNNSSRSRVRLPNCTSYYVLRLAEDEPAEVPATSCLDVFSDGSSREDVPVVVRCAADAPSAVAAVPEISSVLDIRKCCPGSDAVYDVDKKFCTTAAAGEDAAAAPAPLLQARRDFIAVYNGPPACEHALVDYKLGPGDVYNDERGVSISIPWSGGSGARRNVTIDRDNACLDWIPRRSVDGVAPLQRATIVAARLCREADYCLANPCIRKCCPENKINIKCDDAEDSAAGAVVRSFRTSLAAANATGFPAFDSKNYGLLTGKPCSLYYATEAWEEWAIGSLGEFVIPDYPVYNHVNSCLEFVRGDADRPDALYPVICFANDEHYVPHMRYEITASLALISSAFLSATLAVYACLPSLQNLHGKTLMCHVASLLFAYAVLGIVGFLTHGVFDEDGVDANVVDKVCAYLGYLMVFCFHAAFFWLNVMCFDIWWTFGGMRGQSSAASKRRQQLRRFLSYCGYAWGLALVLTALAAMAELTGFLESSVGLERCWFSSRSIGSIVFFAGPVSLTLLVNVVFFAATSRRCSKIKADIKRAMTDVKDPASRKFHSDKTRLIMNLKLFVVMGIPWTLEYVPVYLSYYASFPTWAEELFFVADVVNSLQGVWIFVLFVLKPKVLRALRKRFETIVKATRRGNDASRSGASGARNTLGVAQMGNVRKSSSTSTITSNFMLSTSSAYN